MATARHPKATFFVQRHLFAGLTSFAELESKIAALPDEKSRGDAFEVFAEAYLATQRKYDAVQVWPHDSVPLDILKKLGLTQQDQGIDGVLQTLLGQFDAYQIKFRTGRPALTWRELSTFIGLADSPHIHSRVLLTNCDELPAVLNDRQGFFCIRGSDLDRLEAGDFRAMEAWLADAAYIAPKKSPQPHQTEALNALLPALQTEPRVSAIMACGTGKTLVALWVAEHVARSVGSRSATNDNSPAFQRRVESTNDSSPAGTTEVCKSKSLAMAEAAGHAFSRPGGTLAGAGENPALKRRAIVALSRWDKGGRDAENGHRDGRAPRQSPNWWPCASTGQWQFGVDERGKGRLHFQPQMHADKRRFIQARQGWHICSIHRPQTDKAPSGATSSGCGRKMPPRRG